MSIKVFSIFSLIIILNSVAFPISAGQKSQEEQIYAANLDIAFVDFSEKKITTPLESKETTLNTLKSSSKTEKTEETEKSSIRTRTASEVSKIENYTWNHLINRIKKRENLELKSYICPAGFNTIGYGHTIKSADRKHIKDIDVTGINAQQADSLLNKDLNYCKDWVKKNLQLEGHKLMAITNFCYAFGTTKLRKSQLYKNIKTNQPIDSEIRRWVHINGRAAKNLIREREFELALYNAK